MRSKFFWGECVPAHCWRPNLQGWRMRLLLIEDHERFAKFVKNGLEKEGFTVDAVDAASSGEAARATVKYGTIILDLGLPDADGLDMLRSFGTLELKRLS